MTETEERLVTALAEAERGPQRNGIFALWLVTRVAEALLPPDPLSGRAHRTRLDLLQRRIGSLLMPAPLRRALAGAVRLLADGTPRAATIALHQLVTPTRETVGSTAAEAVALAATRARRMAGDLEKA